MTGALARGSPAVREEAAFVPALLSEIRQVIVGQDYLVNRLLVALLCDGHVLIEGVPGLAKTLAVKTLSEALQVRFSRIQFTPDMLPADINGTLIFNPNEGTFTPRFGPIFANLVLADEINRAPAKVQSALLEAMQEKQVSIGGSTYPLESPFMVLATQNPIEHEGTYPLPEAQVDRFMLKVIIGYPGKREEKLIMERMTAEQAPHARPVVTPAVLLAARQAMRAIHLQEELKARTVTASAGGGMVAGGGNGQGPVGSGKSDPSVVNASDVEMLEDLVLVAITEAQKKAQDAAQREMGKLTGGLSLPFKLPF